MFREHGTLLGRLADVMHLADHARDGSPCEGSPGSLDAARDEALVEADRAAGGDPATLASRAIASLWAALPPRRRREFARLLEAHGLPPPDAGRWQ